MSDKSAETVTVAPDRRLIVKLTWTSPDGAQHGGTHVAGEGDHVSIPAAMTSTLRAEGVIL